MRAALIVVLVGLEMVAWRIVARPGKTNEWNLMVPVFLLQGTAALLAWRAGWFTDSTAGAAVSLGVATGVALYAATRAFVAIADRVPVFRAHVADRYSRASRVPLPLGLVLAVLIAVPGEELFWRGLVQGLVGAHSSEAVGAAVTWIGYIGTKAVSGSLPMVAAAVVGGLVWGGLALLTGGILASVVCHGLWTGLMLAFPPGSGRAEAASREMMPL
ncbi:MAG: protease family protein [Actinomycetota bacterium]|nr:protease family protein [Actinomycetota bacterium]